HTLVTHVGEPRRLLLADLVPQDVPEPGRVRLRRARQQPAPAGGELEPVADDALDTRAREDSRLDGDLRRMAVVRAPARTRVLAFRVLSHEEDVEVAGLAAGEGARDTRQQAAGPEVRPDIERLAHGEDRAPERDVVRDGRITHCAEQDGVVRAQDVDRVGRHHRAVLGVVSRAPRQLGPLDCEIERVDRAAGLRRHFLADPVARDQRDPAAQAGTPRRSGAASTYARASSSETTSAYFAWMSKRFASCGASARSPTHSRGTTVGQPFWSRSIAVAR